MSSVGAVCGMRFATDIAGPKAGAPWKGQTDENDNYAARWTFPASTQPERSTLRWWRAARFGCNRTEHTPGLSSIEYCIHCVCVRVRNGVGKVLSRSVASFYKQYAYRSDSLALDWIFGPTEGRSKQITFMLLRTRILTGIRPSVLKLPIRFGCTIV